MHKAAYVQGFWQAVADRGLIKLSQGIPPEPKGLVPGMPESVEDSAAISGVPVPSTKTPAKPVQESISEDMKITEPKEHENPELPDQ